MKKFRAFSILEVSLALLIISIALTGVLSLIKIIRVNQIKYLNNKKYEYVRYSIQNYLIQHGKLPFAAAKEDGKSTHLLTHGFLPYKDLGIDKSYLYNANHQILNYQVNSYLAQTNIPIVMPLIYKPNDEESSFNRVYLVRNNEIILYDIIAHKPDEIVILENNKSVISEDDFFYIVNPLPKFKNTAQIDHWRKENTHEEKYKCKNTVAWALLHNNEYLYWQSRFNISAQIGFYATPEPILIEKDI